MAPGPRLTKVEVSLVSLQLAQTGSPESALYVSSFCRITRGVLQEQPALRTDRDRRVLLETADEFLLTAPEEHVLTGEAASTSTFAKKVLAKHGEM